MVRLLFTSPLVGEVASDAKHRRRVRGFYPIDRNPSPVADCVRATLSHKGRGEEN
jgi:hypothetical protein